MSDSKNPSSQPIPDDPQQLVNFMTNEEWDALLHEIDTLVREMDDLPYPNVKEQVFTLLAGIDTLHREALTRLVRLFKDGVLEKVVTDPAIHTLMELYDLLPVESKPADDQLSKIQFTTAPSKKKKHAAPAQAATTQAPTPAAQPPKPMLYPHWVPVLKNRGDLGSGQTKQYSVDDHLILLCRVEEEFFALNSACVQDDVSLDGASLTKFTLTCPHHKGCYYDVRDGGRVAGTLRLECYPVKQDDKGRVLVGLGMPFKPRLPAF